MEKRRRIVGINTGTRKRGKNPKGKCIKLLGVDKWLRGKFYSRTPFLSLAAQGWAVW